MAASSSTMGRVDDDHDDASSRGPAAAAADDAPPARTTRWTPIIIMLVMLGVDSLSYIMCFAPQTQLFEDIACRKHYSLTKSAVDSGNGDWCKAPEVQDTVAQLFGWQAFFDGIPGLLLAMHYGVMADKRGRQPVMFLSKLGSLLAMIWLSMCDFAEIHVGWFELPLRLMWLSSLFTIIGGGGTVGSAVCLMILTDSTLEENRSRFFFQTNAVLIFSELIGPPLSTLMMQSNVWLPLGFALMCTIFTTVLAALIPETLPAKPTKAADDASDDSNDEENSTLNQTSKKTLGSTWKHASETIRYMIGNKSLLLLVVSFLAVDFARQSLTILLQYVSNRYTISIAKRSVKTLPITEYLSQANLLLSCKSLAQLVVSAALLPILDSLIINRFKVPAKVKDLRLARMSISLIMVGFAVLVVAPRIWVVIVGLVFYTMGTGFGAFARSLVSSLGEQHMIGTLFTTLAIMDTIGSLLAGPTVAATFSWSLRLGGVLRGMPYLFAFILCGLATLALMQVRLPPQQRRSGASEDEESTAFLRPEGSQQDN
ncbi:MFS transporter [Purpureocillium lavendulum]|uniref:MFS transporter n=1 Tax=Purpureocillium lavendulum TaxID=1247861 RepID=A0AB34FVC4_9HYPO|nr:MFS transporter [Purpureocillium lavendulum]